MLGSPGKAIGAFFAWWGGELAALIPWRARRRQGRRAPAATIELAADAVRVLISRDRQESEIGRVALGGGDKLAARAAAVVPLLAKARARRSGAALRLAPELALRKSLDLPIAAEENLREVLAFELDRHTPFKAEEAYFDFRVVRRDRDAQRLGVELAVAPRRLIDDALRAAEGWGVTVGAIGIAGDAPGAAAPFDLMPAPESASGQGRRVLVPVLAVCAAALAAVVVYLPLERERVLAEELQRRVAAARADADAAVAMREEIDHLKQGALFLIERKRQAILTVKVLDDLTRLIPDTSWVFQFQVVAGEITMAGYSASASGLIPLLEEAPEFAGAQFRSPVTQDPREGLERFQISVGVAGGAAP